MGRLKRKHVVIYSRVSTGKQDYARQNLDLMDYANAQGWYVRHAYNEKVSGAKANEDRPMLRAMLDSIQRDPVEAVMVWELSRLGRNTVEVLKAIKLFHENGVNLFVKNYNINTLNEDGTENPMAAFMIQILSAVAEMERKSIRERMKSGYDKWRNDGGLKNRTPNPKLSRDGFLSKHQGIISCLNDGLSIRKTAAATSKSVFTVQKVKKMLTGIPLEKQDPAQLDLVEIIRDVSKEKIS